MRYLTAFICLGFLLLSLGLPPSAAADASSDQLVEFFQPVTATVIMPVESGVLIDKGAADHIAPGDLLSVVKREIPLRNPRTGQVVDTQTEYGPQIVVTKVKPHLSYCKVLGGLAAPLSEGTRVRRFADVPVFFVDSTATGFQFFQTLRDRLPWLKWNDYVTDPQAIPSVPGPRLVIRYAPDRVTVLDAAGRVLFAQAVTASQPAPQHHPVAAPAAAAARKPEAFSGAWEVRRFDLPIPGEVEALRLSDLDGDAAPEVLIGVGGELIVAHLQGAKLVVEARFSLPGRQEIVDISALDLNGDGTPEVAVTALRDNQVQARILSYRQKTLQVIAKLPMAVGTFQSGDGASILLGVDAAGLLDQRPQLYRLNLVGDRVDKTPIDLAGVRQPYGVTSVSDPQGRKWLAELTAGDHLRVLDAQGEVRWESGKNYGGSLQAIAVHQPGSRNTETFDKYFFHGKLARAAEGVLLVAHHQGPGLWRNSPSYTNGRLVELRWNGTTADELDQSPDLGGMVVDFDRADLDGDGTPDLVAAMLYRQAGFMREARSGLVILKPRR